MSGDNKPICSSCDESNLPLHFEFNICSNCLFNRAHNETKNDNFLEAIELHEKGVEFDLSINDSQGAEHNLFGIALARERLGDYEIAEELFRTCLGECRKRGYDPESEHHYLGILVSYSVEKRDYEGTEQICNQLLPIQSELGKRHEEAMTTELLAWCALNRENNDLEKSEKLYRKAVRIYNELNIPLEIWFHKHGYTDPDSAWAFPPPTIPADLRLVYENFWKYKEDDQTIQFTKGETTWSFGTNEDGSFGASYGNW